MKAFLAMIIPVGDSGPSGPVDPGYSPPWAQVPPGGPIGGPPGFWGPNDPRPTNPIAGPGRPPWWGIANDPGYSPPWATPRPPGGPVDPGYSPPWAQVPPGGPSGSPPGIWGPNDPRPTNPIAGWNPGTGTWPQPPKPPGTPGQLPGSDPSGSGWVYAFVPGYGWMWCKVPPAPGSVPHPDQTLPTPEPPVEPAPV